jgi:hypothetical protein
LVLLYIANWYRSIPSTLSLYSYGILFTASYILQVQTPLKTWRMFILYTSVFQIISSYQASDPKCFIISYLTHAQLNLLFFLTPEKFSGISLICSTVPLFYHSLTIILNPVIKILTKLSLQRRFYLLRNVYARKMYMDYNILRARITFQRMRANGVHTVQWH